MVSAASFLKFPEVFVPCCRAKAIRDHAVHAGAQVIGPSGIFLRPRPTYSC